MERRAFLTAAGVAAAAPSLPPARAAAGGLVDTNVYLSSWPVRHSQPDTPARVVEKLRQHGVASAWAGSFEGALHTDIAGANVAVTRSPQSDDESMNRRTFLNSTGAAFAAPMLAGASAAAAVSNSAGDPAASAWGSDELRKLGIWDIHAHVGTPGPTPAKRMETLLRIADRMGVERLCICMSPPWQYEPTPEQFRRSNDDVLEILKEWSSRAFGFVYLNPTHTRESLAELERCVADGPMIGIKLWVGLRCSAPQLDPIVQRAAELDALILQHTWIKQRGKGNLPGESTPMDLAALSARHPGVPIVCGHTGGGDGRWAFAPSARGRSFSPIWAAAIRCTARSKWRCVNWVRSACSTAATSTAEASARKSGKCWARTFRLRTRNGSCARIYATSCNRRCAGRESRHERGAAPAPAQHSNP